MTTGAPVGRRRGEIVVKLASAGFAADEFLAIILDDGEPDDCFPACGNPGCTEWPTLRELSRARRYAYHVSECEMATPATSRLRGREPAGTTSCLLCGRRIWSNESTPPVWASTLAGGADCS